MRETERVCEREHAYSAGQPSIVAALVVRFLKAILVHFIGKVSAEKQQSQFERDQSAMPLDAAAIGSFSSK